MNYRKPQFLLFIFLLIITFIQIVYFNIILPQEVASHFNLAGTADRFTSKNLLSLIHVLIVLGLSALFGLAGLFIEKIPSALLNLPNKDYWMTPERKKKTYETFTEFMFMFADAALIFFLLIFQQVYSCNLRPDKNLGGNILYFILSFGVVICVFSLLFFKKFSGTDEE